MLASTDYQLIQQINSRSKDSDAAMHAIYQRYQAALIRNTRRHSYLRGKPHLLDELVQNALVALFEKPSEWTDERTDGKGASLLTWLNVKIEYLLADVIRNDRLASKRGGNIQDYLAQLKQSSDNFTANTSDIEAMSQYTAQCLKETACSAEQQAYTHEKGKALNECMQSLDATKQFVALSALLHRIPHADIAKVENCPEATVRTRLSAARKLLAKCLQRKGFDSKNNNVEGLV